MNTHQDTFHYEHGGNIDLFHELLVWHPKLKDIRNKFGILFHALRLAEQAHQSDTRKSTGLPYINHQIEIILDILQRKETIKSIHDIIVMALHDILEDHPKYWKEIYYEFGINVFRDVLILATGGLAEGKEKPTHPLKTVREEMKEFFYQDLLRGKYNRDTLLEILCILEPISPLEKFHKYGHNYRQSPQESQHILRAIEVYRLVIIESKKQTIAIDTKNTESYIALGNYLFFNKNNAIQKCYDMLNNMSDMTEMSKQNPEYLKKRRIKAYILGIILFNFNLTSEYEALQVAFQKAGSSMPTHQEIGCIIEEAKDNKVPIPISEAIS